MGYLSRDNNRAVLMVKKSGDNPPVKHKKMVSFNAVSQRQWQTRKKTIFKKLSVYSVAKLLPPMTDQGNLEKFAGLFRGSK